MSLISLNWCVQMLREPAPVDFPMKSWLWRLAGDRGVRTGGIPGILDDPVSC